MMTPRNSLFAEQEREDRRMKLGNPLVRLTEHMDFEALGARIGAIAPRPSRARGGRPVPDGINDQDPVAATEPPRI